MNTYKETHSCNLKVSINFAYNVLPDWDFRSKIYRWDLDFLDFRWRNCIKVGLKILGRVLLFDIDNPFAHYAHYVLVNYQKA